MFQGLFSFLARIGKRIAKSTIDILIIIGILWAIALTVVPADGFISFMTADGGLIFWAVLLTYGALVLIGTMLVFMGGMIGDHLIARGARFLIITIIVVLGFPFIIDKIFFFMGVTFATDIENILIVASLIRFFVKWWLGRRWGV